MAYHVYNVKQAAKILGLSTNTTYKYLNEIGLNETDNAKDWWINETYLKK